jgi:hypothetical protein
MSQSSSAWWLALALILPADALAAACCGSVAPMPVRVARSEEFLVGAAAGAEVVTARWTPEGTIAPPSPDERAMFGTVAVGWRYAQWGQLTVAVPGRYTWRESGELSDTGGGFGDVAVGAIFDPVVEVRRPVVVFAAAVRAPTGRSWDDSDGDLLADTTGLPGVTAGVGAWIERTETTWNWSVGVDAELTSQELPPRVGFVLTGGRRLGDRWTAVALLRGTAGIGENGTARTTATARLVHGRPNRWRAWAEAGSELPIEELGRSENAAVRGTLGVAIVR